MRLTILFCFCIGFLFSQKAELTGGIIAFNKKDIDTAKELIDVAYEKYMKKLESGAKDKPKIMSKFWHYRGQVYLELGDLDITEEPMEVGPTVHYMMGGIRVDAETSSSTIKGMYSAGESAAGLHGANRLGGNSLSDLLVFGNIAGYSAANFASNSEEVTIHKSVIEKAIEETLQSFGNDNTEDPYKMHAELQDVMEKHVGIVRDEKSLEEGIKKLRDKEWI